jgi:putative transposase
MNRLRSLKSSVPAVKSTSISLKKLKERIRELAAGNKLRLQSLFSDEVVNEMARELGHDFRERVFDPATTLGLYVAQVLNRDEPCSTVVVRFNKERKDKGLDSVSAKASAYCYARNRLPLELLQTLSERTVGFALARVDKTWRWHDSDVYLVDGFTIRAPDTDANQLEFPQPTSQEPGLGYPTIRVVTLTSLAAKVVTHYQYGPMDGKGNGELSLFRKTFEFLKENQVIVGDSNFDSYYDLAVLVERKVNCVFGINGTRDNPFVGQDTPQSGETTRVLAKPRFDHNRISREAWEKLPATVTIRIIAFPVEGRSDQKFIVTTLLDQKEYPAEEISELYGLRWEAELDIRCLKSVMDLADMRCQTPQGLRRELAVNILAYNLVALLLCDTAEVTEQHPRQLSFSHARDTFIHFGDERMTINDLEWLILQTSQFQIKNRPRREEPREIKKRNGKYARLKQPRPSKKAKLTKGNKAQAS